LYRAGRGRPVTRIVDFESSYEVARHAKGGVYNPPTTPGFCAPEVGDQVPDGRSDVFSLGAVLYTMIAGYGWTWDADLSGHITSDVEIDSDLKIILLRAVAREVERRYQSVQELRAALADYLESIWPGRSKGLVES
jgi:serine/threonine protein kinase